MGLLSRFKSKSERPATTAAPSARAWRMADLQAFSAGEDLHIVCRREGTPLTVPAFVVDFIFGCRKFLPLDEHIAKHADKHGWTSLQLEALGSWLPRMIEAGLLVSSTQLSDRCAAMKGAATP